MNTSQLSKELQIIRELSNAVVHSRDVQTILDCLLSTLSREMGMERAMVTLRYGDELVAEASCGLDEAEQKLGHYHLGEGIVGHVAETGRPHIIPDVRKEKRFLNRSLNKAVPLRAAVSSPDCGPISSARPCGIPIWTRIC